MISVAEARARILAGVEVVETEVVPLAAARNRVLAADARARLTQPPFDTTSMDGYAVRAVDAAAGAVLRVIGESSAGKRFARPIGPGEAVRIFTGAPLPSGADAVVPQESTRADGTEVVIHDGPVPIGRHVRRAGLDFSLGAAGLMAGRVLDARALGLAAAMDLPRLTVRRRPRVALLANGDELVRPGAARGPDQIVASSIYAVRALCEDAGAEVIDLGLAPDRREALAARIAAARDIPADVLVTLGGASVGTHDLVKTAFAEAGLDLGFWQIAMRPGKPLVFGRLGAQRVLGLPGNPVSSYVCALLFLVPLIRALVGLAPGPFPVSASLGTDLRANDAREDYLRATIRAEGRRLIATPLPVQDSSMQAALAAADGLVMRPASAPAAREGDAVRMIVFDAMSGTATFR